MSTMTATPALRLAFYGDDFTGSTDALEVLSSAGWRCALFLQEPDARTLARHPGLDAVGIAGDSRAMTPAEMDAQLPPTLDWLARAGAPVIHYKVCSTFDSGPGIGSIGRVMELARARLAGACIPIVAATPHLARFCVYGNLFARAGTDGRIYRIDRHPIMKVHPVTPMDEGDLAVHLARQCGLTLLADPTALDFGGRRWLLSHGDALCLADADYLRFRAQVRTPQWIQSFLQKPLAEREAVARQLRDASLARHAVTTAYADVDAPLARQWLQAAGAQALVHGHTHRPAEHDLGDGLRRIVLADWDPDATPPRGEVLRLWADGRQARLPLPVQDAASGRVPDPAQD